MYLNNISRTCRLCLKFSNGGFQLDETLQSNLYSLYLYPDIAVTDEPTICETCADSLEQCLAFKIKCNLTEDHVASIKSSYLDQNCCCFCLETVKSSSFVLLDNDEIEMLQKYFPELDITTKQTELCTCRTCRITLKRHFDFIKCCLEIEKKIIDYCRVEGTNSKGQVDLSDVANFTFKNVVKTENFVQAVKMEDTALKNSEKPKTTSEIKVESDIEIKHVKLEKEIELQSEQLEIFTPPKSVPSTQHPHKCQQCDYSAKRPYNLKLHMLSHKSVREVPTYKCEKCDFETKYKQAVCKHMITHKNGSEITMNKCHLCGYQAKHKYTLREHMIVHKSRSEVTFHGCTECEFETKHKKNLRIHMLIHRSEDVVAMNACHVCEYKTRIKSDLRKHLLVHKASSEVAMHKCTECSYETRQKSNLRRHAVMHKSNSEVIMHKCARCSYENRQKDNLRKHMATHGIVS